MYSDGDEEDFDMKSSAAMAELGRHIVPRGQLAKSSQGAKLGGLVARNTKLLRGVAVLLLKSGDAADGGPKWQRRAEQAISHQQPHIDKRRRWTENECEKLVRFPQEVGVDWVSLRSDKSLQRGALADRDLSAMQGKYGRLKAQGRVTDRKRRDDTGSTVKQPAPAPKASAATAGRRFGAVGVEEPPPSRLQLLNKDISGGQERRPVPCYGPRFAAIGQRSSNPPSPPDHVLRFVAQWRGPAGSVRFHLHPNLP